MATRGGAASSSSSTGGGMKRVPTWLTVSNLKLDADLKRRHDAETSIEWEWHLDPDFECGLTHLDLEHLRDVAVRKGMGDDETRRIAWPIVLGIGLEPGERRDAGEYVDRAAYIEAARQLLDGGGGASSSRGGAGGGGDNSDDSALERPGRAPNDAATIEADVQRSLWAFTEGWSEARRQQLRESLRRVVAGSVHAQHGANPGCINYLQGFHSVAGVVLVVLKDEALAAAAMERLALYHLRDSTRSSPVNLLDAMELVSPLLRRADAQLHDAVFHKHNIPAHFSIEWLMTWHVHSDLDVMNVPEGMPGYDSSAGCVGGARRNAARLARATRLIDAFLLSHPLFSIYVGVAEMLRIKDRLMAIEHDWEMFQRLKKLRIARDEVRELELEHAVVMEGMAGAQSGGDKGGAGGDKDGSDTPGGTKKKKAWWRKRPKMKKSGSKKGGVVQTGSGGESDGIPGGLNSLSSSTAGLEPTTSGLPAKARSTPAPANSPPLPPRHVRNASIESNVSARSDRTGGSRGYTSDDNSAPPSGLQTPDLGFAEAGPSSLTATLGDEHEGGADALHDGDWVELARLDDLLRAAQDLFEAHPPATLYEDGGLIPPAGSACTMYPYPWWYHGFHLDDVTEKGMRALEVKETNRRVVVDHRWRDELAHERRGEMARSPLPPEIARGPPLNSADDAHSLDHSRPRRWTYAGDRRWDKVPPNFATRAKDYVANGSSTKAAGIVVFIAVAMDMYSTLYVRDTCGSSVNPLSIAINGGMCASRAWETMRTYVFFARCYHWMAWFLDLFTDPIFGELAAFCVRVLAAEVAWASELVPIPGGARRLVQALTSGIGPVG